MIQTLDNFVNAINGILYQPYVVPLFLLVAGIFFTFRSKFIQIRMFKEMFKVIGEKPKSEGGISSFGALMVSTASRVGTGNIIGVSTAICTGGPGAIFWMWLIAFLGGATAFVESTLAQIYKKKAKDGSSYGGPAYYMQEALGQRWMGVIFAICVILTYALGYNLIAAYNLQSTFTAFSFYKEGVTPAIIGAILAVLFCYCIISGGKRLTKVTEVLVPIMGVIYILVAIVALVINAKNLGAMFGMIFTNAFDFKAIFGGFTGSCIMWGIKRGLYSNEAGMGSAPNAAATADVSHPAKQGLVQMLSVFIDTLLICTATALMCMSSGIVPEADLAGAAYVQESLHATFGSFGPIFLAVAMTLFAFTTLIGNYSYCEGQIAFIMKKQPSKTFSICFRIVASIIVFLGAVISANLAWDTADLTQGLMVVVNVPAILILTKPAMKALDDYVTQRKAGKNPEFHPDNMGITKGIDFWK